MTGGARRIGRAIALALHRGRLRGRDPGATLGRRGRDACATRSCAPAGAPRWCAPISPIMRRSRDSSRRRPAALGPLSLLVNNAVDVRAGRDRRARCRRASTASSPSICVRRCSSRSLRRAGAVARRARSSTSSISACSSCTPHFVSYTLAKSALHAATAHAGAGAGAEGARQCGGAGADDAERAPAAGGFRPPGGRGAARPRTDAEEIAAAVVYLAGARSVTGVTLAVDGGQHLAWQTPDASVTE